MALIFTLRNLRFLHFASEISSIRLINETMRHITRPILGKFLFLYIIFYLYAQVGMMLLGGDLTYKKFDSLDSKTPFYYLMNFNDYASALVTLFSQMVVNNWFITVDMYTDIKGPGNVWWVRIFFISFWIVIVLIQLNIVIAVILEIYSSVTEEVYEHKRKIDVAKKLKAWFKDENELTIRLRIEEARRILDEEEERLNREHPYSDSEYDRPETVRSRQSLSSRQSNLTGSFRPVG